MTKATGNFWARLAGGRAVLSRTPFWVWALVAVTIAAIVVGLLIRASLLGGGSLWLDELWTLDAVSRSFKEMIGARLVSDVHPPLWSMLAWLWLRIVGTYDAATVRLLPLGLGVATVAAPLLGTVWLRSLRPTLLVMAALLGLSLLPLQYSVEMRSYSMLLALGTSATVLWAGLLAGDLPLRGRWIFVFALTGALAAFTHYYGLLLYVGELSVLVLMSLFARRRDAAVLLLGWGGLSLLPIATWYLVTSRWFPGHAVAPPPSVSAIQTWLAYAFGPVSNVLANHGPGYAYPDVPFGIETVLFGLVVVATLAAAASNRIRSPGRPLTPAIRIGGAALSVIFVSLVGAWVASIVLPPSLNARNLAALLPLLFLAVGCAATLAATERTRWLTGSVMVGAWLLATAVFTTANTVPALVPPWQQQAGYRSIADALIRAASGSRPPQLVGLLTSWGWHGQWDAALRASLGSPPAKSSSAAPLPVRWVKGVEDLEAAPPAAGPITVFSDTFDPREADVVAWIELSRGPCETTTYGGPAFGAAIAVTCP